ncbi:MAG: TatD family hydrolase [Candidatus Bathyarchaeia archaeon]
MLVDSHAHLQWASFDGDREEVIGRAREAGVECIVNVGFDVDGSRRAVELAERYRGVYATVGVHPHNASQFNDVVLDELRRLAGCAKVVAIGEIGLDFYRNLSPRDSQRSAFEAQLDLAEEFGLPVVVHDREAHGEVLDVLLRFEGRVEGVMHCFSGSKEMAERCLRSGFYVSFAGSVTYPNALRLQEIARWTDLRKILLETDSPWLAPQEMRGKRNEPAFLPFVARKIAELKGVSLSEVAEATARNTKEIFQIG